MNCDS